jgi:hypothetical protein
LTKSSLASSAATSLSERWSAVERWLDVLDPREVFVAVVKQVLQTLSDDKARPAERFEARENCTGG